MPVFPSIANLQVFALFDSGGAPLTGQSPTFTTYSDTTGASRTPPTISEIGGGLYGFDPTAADITVGTVFMIDGGMSANPRYSYGYVAPGTGSSADITAILTAVTSIQGYWANKQTIGVNPGPNQNQQVFYASDGTTPVLRFNLQDGDGNPTSGDIFTKIPAAP